MRTRGVNPKLEYLVDICTALLVRARVPLFRYVCRAFSAFPPALTILPFLSPNLFSTCCRLGKPGRNSPGLWTQEHSALQPLSPLRPWELSDAFTEGIALLTSYPIGAAGGIDRILQTASDLAQKWIEEKDREERERGKVGFGVRITQQMWKGFTNQVADESPEEEEEEENEENDDEENDETEVHDDGNETETPAAPTLTSRLANTVWRGITNQSSMEDEVPSPPSPLSARQSPPPPEEREFATSTSSSQASLWDYAGKLKDSDTVAAFAKVSTNWRAKALDAWGVRKVSNPSVSPRPVAPAQPTSPSAASEVAPRQSGWPGLTGMSAPSQRRESLPGSQRESEQVNLDPPRPAFFRSPRESFLPQPRRQHATAPSTPIIDSTSLPHRDSDTESNASSLMSRAGASLASLATFPLSHPTPKRVPKPLMLNSRDLITIRSPHPQSARSEGGTPEPRGGASQWGDSLLATKNRHVPRHESMSSTSSLSPSEAMNRYPFSGAYARSAGTGPRSDYESDGSTSRKVPLNRKSVSPMALASRSPHLPWNAPSPSGTRSPGHPLSNGSVTAEDMEMPSERGWRHFDSEGHVHSSASMTMASTAGFDSPTTISSPPIPRTPLMPPVSDLGVVRIVNGGSANGGHVPTSSISTLSEMSEANAVPLEPPTQSRLVMRKKTPPLPVLPATPDRDITVETLQSSESGSEALVERTPSGKVAAPVKVRSKRYAPRPGNLRLRPAGSVQSVSDQRTPSPGQRGLTAEWPGEHELATTPRADSYSGGTGEEGVEEGTGAVVSRPPYVRKSSKESRVRKVSPAGRRVRDSGAEEGDDEGYDELLSAYESEEGSRE